MNACPRQIFFITRTNLFYHESKQFLSRAQTFFIVRANRKTASYDDEKRKDTPENAKQTTRHLPTSRHKVRSNHYRKRWLPTNFYRRQTFSSRNKAVMRQPINVISPKPAQNKKAHLSNQSARKKYTISQVKIKN